MKHGDIQPLFDHVWWVIGTAKPAPPIKLSRNMQIIKYKDELALINAIRLDERGLQKLQKLGTIRHVVKIGFHSMDDDFYHETFGAKRWRLPGVSGGDEELREDNVPFPNLMKLFNFEKTLMPEAAILIEYDHVLLTCDSVQHWDTKCHPYTNIPALAFLTVKGFKHPCQIGPPWMKKQTPEGATLKSDFERLIKLPFKHLLGPHGGVALDTAPEMLQITMDRMF